MCVPNKKSETSSKAPQENNSDPEKQKSAKSAKSLHSTSANGATQSASKEVAKKSAEKSAEVANKSSKSSKSFKVSAKDKEAIKKGEEWLKNVLTKGVPKTMEEFRALAKWKPDNMTTEACMANKEKARYLDVPCQDERRVVLKHPGLGCDFIHANYVSTTTNDKRFICTQGPLENTQVSFWAMIVQENVEIIVMLCNTIECGKLKCFQYYPGGVGESLKFGEKEGEITVTNMKAAPLSEEEPTIRLVTLKVSALGKERLIKHYLWENWPDRGVPPTTSTALTLIKAVRDVKSPIVVHCSAGIGRTGTIVAITYVQEKMQNGECCMAMDELLKEIRKQRPYSIQNEMQYIYLHRVLLSYLLETHKERYGSLLNDPEISAKWDEWKQNYEKATTFST